MNHRTRPEISFILPGFNVEKYLSLCVQSIINQPVQNIEIIYIDDLSTDNSLKVCQNLAKKDNRIKIVQHTINKGSYAARNTGLSLASGEWIAFIDPDDVLSPLFYECIGNFLDDKNNNLIIYHYEIFNDGEALPKVSIKNKPPSNLNEIDLLNIKDFTWLKLIRLDWLRTTDICFYEGKTMWDILFHWRVCLHAKSAIYVDENLIYYRQRTSASSYRKDWYRAEGFQVMDKLREFLSININNKLIWDEFFLKEINLYYDISRAFIGSKHLLERANNEIKKRITLKHWAIMTSHSLFDSKKRDYLITFFRPNNIKWSAKYLPNNLRCFLILFLKSFYRQIKSLKHGR